MERIKLTITAIRFVLSDKYTSMAREERQSLLHHGTSQTTTMSAYVEIVFDSELHVFWENARSGPKLNRQIPMDGSPPTIPNFISDVQSV